LRDSFVLLIKVSAQIIKLKLTYTKTTSDNSLKQHQMNVATVLSKATVTHVAANRYQT
jgi:hypothetical protein